MTHTPTPQSIEREQRIKNAVNIICNHADIGIHDDAFRAWAYGEVLGAIDSLSPPAEVTHDELRHELEADLSPHEMAERLQTMFTIHRRA